MNASCAKSGSTYPKLRGLVTFIVAIAWVLCAGGCATHGLKIGEDGRLRHPDLGYAIDTPDLDPGAGWRHVSLDDTDLAYRTDDGRSMSLSSSCKQTRAKPALLARRLLIGIPRDDIVSAYPIALGGEPGWAQVVETGEGVRAVRIKTVTLVSAGCVFDFVLVANAGKRFDESLPAFDDWWVSFERDPDVAAAIRAAHEADPGTEEAGVSPPPTSAETDGPVQ